MGRVAGWPVCSSQSGATGRPCVHTRAAPVRGRPRAPGAPSRPAPGHHQRRLAPAEPDAVQPTPRPDAADVDVPEIGWLWNVGKPSASGDKDGPSSQPSAQATVADLRKDRIKAKKSLGQNFLTDDGILRDIVAAAGVRPGDLVMEVGPGTGNLTKHLLAAGALVTAVEKDDTLHARLATEYAGVPALRLVHGDVLRLPQAQLLDGMLGRDRPAEGELVAGDAPGGDPPPSTPPAGPSPAIPQRAQKVKVVANLPYNITTDFLKRWLPQGEDVAELHIMLQEEAGVRLVRSKPGDADYRAMSLRVALYSRPSYRFRIPKEKYYPQPGVDGALITFALTPPPARPRLPSEPAFLALLDRGFSQRRKMLRNSLQPSYEPAQVDAALAEVGGPVGARAQDLSLAQWVKLHRSLARQAGQTIAKPLQSD